MIELFQMGGYFMYLVTLFGIISLLFLVQSVRPLFRGERASPRLLRNMMIAGGTAFASGLLAQVAGLYQAMSAIEAAGDISPALLAGGFKVSMIAPIYGLLIFLGTLAGYLLIQFFQPSGEKVSTS
ncbi:MAG: MotA/TolQ/ExbB proton channel family protein [Balneolaceae bacterium]|nr:MotA/TolQ/ExbB proton channel family protein [Balneolaceae bacterium]